MKREKIFIKLLTGLIPLIIVGMLLGAPGGCTSEGRDSGGTIWGTMRSGDNPDEGVTNALVSLDDRSVFAITSGTGYFSVLGVPVGKYDVTITKFGHELFKGSAAIDRDAAYSSGDISNRFADVSFMVEFPGAVPGEETLAATLLDPDGKPIVGAEIDLVYKKGGYLYVADSDTAGSFYLEKIAVEPDLLLIDAEGFRPAAFGAETIAMFMESGAQGALVNLIPLERDEPISGKAPATITGSVRDNSNSTVADIKVALIPYDPDVKPIDSIAKIRTTHDGGIYDFTNIDPGEYIIWAGGPNYFPVEQRVTLTPGASITVNFILNEATNRETHPKFKPGQPGGMN